MTAKEKKERARIRKELRSEGLLPPVKKPLNRKKFCDEAIELLDGINLFLDGSYLGWALLEMLHHSGGKPGLSLEAVGAAKVIHLVVARKRFEAELREQGKTQYTFGELLEAVEAIYKA